MASPIRRLIPFIYSASIAYQVELGEEYARFYYDDTLIDTISTPYLEEHLFELQTKQLGDTMWIVHRGYAPRKLTRVDVDEFSLDIIAFNKGPFLTRNDLLDPDDPSTTTLTCAVTAVGDVGLLTASAEVFVSGHEGALFKLIHPRATTEITRKGTSGEGESAALDVKGSYRFITTGTWAGTCILQRRENETDWENFRTYTNLTSGAQNAEIPPSVGIEKFDNVEYRIHTDADITAGFGATLNVHNPNREGIVKVITIIDAYHAVVEVVQELELTTATLRWAEGAWSDERGWPSAIAFIGNRIVYAGATRASARVTSAVTEYPSLRTLNA